MKKPLNWLAVAELAASSHEGFQTAVIIVVTWRLMDEVSVNKLLHPPFSVFYCDTRKEAREKIQEAKLPRFFLGRVAEHFPGDDLRDLGLPIVKLHWSRDHIFRLSEDFLRGQGFQKTTRPEAGRWGLTDQIEHRGRMYEVVLVRGPDDRSSLSGAFNSLTMIPTHMIRPATP